MCLAIYRAPDAQGRITPDELRRSYNCGNNDGYGAMFAQHGTLHIYKNVDARQFDTFIDWIETVQNANVPVAVHLRLATHGKELLPNAHPFEVIPGELAIMHNGMLRGYNRDSADSDTAQFAKELATLGAVESWWGNPFIWSLLAEYVGAWSNKIILMRNTGDVRIIGASQGETKEGVWYSNSSYRAPKYTTTAPRYAPHGVSPYSPSSYDVADSGNWPTWYRDQQKRLTSGASDGKSPTHASAQEKEKKRDALLDEFRAAGAGRIEAKGRAKRLRDAVREKRFSDWKPAANSRWRTRFMDCQLYVCGGCVKDAALALDGTRFKFVKREKHKEIEVTACEWCNQAWLS